jgi:glycerol-3-phosphate acyltransferase PlsY
MNTFFIVSLIGYGIGCLPVAFVMLKLTKGLDIRTVGSGNVGALNAAEVSGKAWLGVVVAVLDMLKGYAAIWMASQYFGNEWRGVAAGAVVLGHCYPVTLAFKGGRGIATAFGALVLFVPKITVTWIVIWILAFSFSKMDKGRRIHFGNISASLATPLIMPLWESYSSFYLSLFICGLIFVRHLDVAKAALMSPPTDANPTETKGT